MIKFIKREKHSTSLNYNNTCQNKEIYQSKRVRPKSDK